MKYMEYIHDVLEYIEHWEIVMLIITNVITLFTRPIHKRKEDNGKTKQTD